MLRIQSLTRSFGDRRAVDALDLEVRPGETFGFLGPNGAGKSTTMACAVGAMRPDSGTISIGDVGPPTERAARRRIGYAPQDLAIYAELTGEENARFFGKLQGLSGKDLGERVAGALELVGLTDRRRDAAGKYSGGMKRRLNLACALVHDPDLVFLDEPTAGVDPQSRNLLFETVERLAADGKTVVYTTHYMEEAARLCNRVAIIDHGRLLALGTVDELITTHGGTPVLSLACVDPPAPDSGLPAPDAAGWLRIETDEPAAELARIAATGLRYREAVVRRPDLETVFLTLTGKSLRDA